MPERVPLQNHTVNEAAKPSALVVRDEWQDRMAEHNGIDGLPDGNIHEPRVIADIEHPETRLKALKEGLRDTSGASRELNGHIAQTHGAIYESQARELLADPATEAYLARRSDALPTDELVALWPRFQEKYREGLHKGISLGYIPKVAARRFERALVKTRVRIVDHAVLKVWSQTSKDIGGYYNAVDGEIGLNHTNDIELQQEVLTHEFGHDTAGGTFMKAPPTEPARPEDGMTPIGTVFEDVGMTRTRAGFSTELPATESRKSINTHTGLDEATNHHTTLGILTGDFENLDPDDRNENDEDGIYWDARKIYAKAIKESDGLITVKMLTNGFYEETGPEGGFSTRKAMIRGFVKSYGWGAIRKLEKLYAAADKFVPEDRLEELILGRIHGPEIDEDGTITKVGYIDTDGLPTEPVQSIDEVHSSHVELAREIAKRRSEAMLSNPEPGTLDYLLAHASFAEAMELMAQSGTPFNTQNDTGGISFVDPEGDEEGIIDMRTLKN